MGRTRHAEPLTAVSARLAVLWAAALLLSPALAAEQPDVWIDSPPDKQGVRGFVTIEIKGSDLRQVNVMKDGAFLESVTVPPFRFQWDTRGEMEGPHSLVARGIRKNGQEVTSSGITLNVDNTPPSVRLTKPTLRATIVGKTELEAEASDLVAVAEVRFLVDGNAVGAAKAAPYRIDWDSSKLSNGVHALEAVAMDRSGNKAVSDFVEVRSANRNNPPVFTPVTPVKLSEGETLQFRISAYDPEGPRDPITFRAINFPRWATLDPKTGEFRAVPTADAASLEEPEKVYKLRVQACDPEPLCVSVELPVTVVNVNQPPTLKRPDNVELRENESVTIVLDAHDPDGDPLVYSVGGIPTWMTFNGPAHTLSGVPPVDTATQDEPRTEYEMSCKATDPNDLVGEGRFLLTVVNQNSPPVLKTIPEIRTGEGKAIAFTAEASDADGDPLAIVATPLPPGAQFQDNRNGTGTFYWKTGQDQAGHYNVTFTATDGVEKDTQLVGFTIGDTGLSISGRITNSIGEGFPGSTVHFTAAGQSRRTTTCDSSGNYILSGLPPATYTVKPVYEIPDTFLVEATKSLGYFYNPLSRRVELDKEDVKDVNFIAQPK